METVRAVISKSLTQKLNSAFYRRKKSSSSPDGIS